MRTQRALGEALVELMLAHAWADISVQQVLDRARVGRATFYAHFRGKDDLLLSDAERFWGMMEAHFLRVAPGTTRVAPVAELFAHVADFARFTDALARAGLQGTVYDLLAGHIARLIERRLAELRPDAERASLPRAGMARVFAAALLEMLRWWTERPDRPSPREMDHRFHELVWGGVARVAP
ncbi:TetR/AcrR family transcriptional regulator [Roseisolibacter sp. H3M3-2]|uniref:TetR/AcrR family transcriptional regulator n=1 Tax=Roseisolibacter sp. H3M3-2 TaxID=3031323 RepID=UPI0023DA9EC6|nr:TetR/AcrR family transcriptional regulator [Roseisolibacter sp. H3M3-2]MDF1505813.1 TetR/AcrR family transcriptional regulator [Roseisolibacter sp. H3M3-2]